MARRPWIVPLFGTRRLERLEENLGAAAVALSADDLAEITVLSSEFRVRGDRYPEDMLNRCGL